MLAKKLGFEVQENDIEELLQSHCNELSNEDLLVLERTMMKEHKEAETLQAKPQERVLSLKVLSEAMSNLREVLDLIEKNDPDVQRSSLVSCRVLASFGYFQEMLPEKQQKTI